MKRYHSYRTSQHQLTHEVKQLAKIIKQLQRERPFDVMQKPGRLLWLAFLKGIMVGFGSVLGATVLVALAIYILSQIQFVPVFGDWIRELIEQIKDRKSV